VIKNDVLQRLMGVDTKTLYDYRQIGMAGGFLAGSSYNGAHAANGLTASSSPLARTRRTSPSRTRESPTRGYWKTATTTGR
jgi:hypothetical protein